MPALRSLYNRYHNESSSFQFLAISLDTDPAEAAAFAEAEKLPFPVILDPTNQTAKAYEVSGIPTLFVVDKSGKIDSGHIGYDATVEFLVEQQLHIQSTPMSTE